MDTICKYSLFGDSMITIKATKFLNARLQDGHIAFWVISNSETDRTYAVNVVQEIRSGYYLNKQYIGTVQDLMGYVWHVFAEEVVI